MSKVEVKYNVQLTEKEYLFLITCIGNSNPVLMRESFDMNDSEIDIFESMFYNKKIEHIPNIETIKKFK